MYSFNDFLSLFTKDNITFLIAILGFGLSIYNFLHERFQNRLKLRVTYKNHHISQVKGQENELTISLSVENLVKNPLSVTRMFLNINCKQYEFYWVPQIVYYADYKCRNKILDKIKLHTIDIPFKLDGYGVVGGFFFVSTDKKLTDQFLFNSSTSITVYSNKGKHTYPISFDTPGVEI